MTKIRCLICSFFFVVFLLSFPGTAVNADSHQSGDVFKLKSITSENNPFFEKESIKSIEAWSENSQVIFVRFDGENSNLFTQALTFEAELIDKSAKITVNPYSGYQQKGRISDTVSNISQDETICTFNCLFYSGKTGIPKPHILPITVNYAGSVYDYYIVLLPTVNPNDRDLMLANAETEIFLDDGYFVNGKKDNRIKAFTVNDSVKAVSLETLFESERPNFFQNQRTGFWVYDGEIYARINGNDYNRIIPSGNIRGETLSAPFVLKEGINILEISCENTGINMYSTATNTNGLRDFRNSDPNPNYYYYIINKKGKAVTDIPKKSDTSIRFIDATHLGSAAIPCARYSVVKGENDGEYIIGLPENLPKSSLGTVFNKVIFGVITSDPEATVELKNVKTVGDKIWIYQAVQVTKDDGSYIDAIDFTVTAADKVTTKDYTIKVTHASSDADITGIDFDDGILKDYTTKEQVPFDKDKHLYLLQSSKNTTSVSIQKPEGATIIVDGKIIQPNEEGKYIFDTSKLATVLQIKAADLVSVQKYYFITQQQDGTVPLNGQTEATLGQAKTMLTGWNNRSEEQKKNLSDSYWSYYMTAATGLPLNHTVAYDVTKHSFNYGSDAASVVMELVMTGNNPYDYNGEDYVKKLKSFKNGASYGPFASDTWTLMALRMCGEPIEQSLIDSVTGTAKSINGGDIRPWALAALSNWDKISQEDIVAMTIEMKETLQNDGLWGNAYTNGCYLTGIGASGVNIDYFSTDKGTFLDQYAKTYMTEDYKFSYAGEEDKFVKDAIIGLGDLVHQRSIWASYALTNDKMKQLIDQAKDIDLSSATDEEKTALNQAIDAAEAVQNAESGYGPAYYALYEAMKQIDDRYNLHVRLCSWDQSQKIDKVMADIDALAGKELTFASASDIKTVTDAYKALIEEDKRFADYVENADKLDQVAENYAKLIDEAIVKADTSSEKGKLVSKENTAAIDQVRSALDSLAEDQKKNVKNLEAFKELEKTYTDSVAELVSAVDAAMTKAKEDTSDGTIVSKEASASIEAIKSDLDKLTEDQQKQIAGLDGFKDLDAAYTAKVGEIVDDIDESITNLKESSKDGTVVNQTNTAAVKETKEKLDMLTDSQQASVSGLDTFTALDATYSDSVEKLIKAVDDAIAKVDETSKGGTVVSTEATKAIDEINKALGDLTEEQKGKLTNAESFASLEPAYKDAVAKEVKAVEDEINALQSVNSEEMTDEEKASVSKTLDRIDNLTEDQQKEISNLASLKPYEDVVRAEAANAAISALPNPVTSLNQKDAVTAAREAYDKLSKEAVEKLKTMDPDAEKKLLAAEEAIKALENGDKPQKEATKKDTLPKVGQKVTVSGKIYKITASSKVKKTVSLIGTKSKKIKSLSVPSAISIKKYRYKVTTIGAGAVKKCTKLKKLVIGNNVVNIGANAFFGCKNLKKVTIGTNISVIGGKAFYGCKKLKKIVIRGKKLKMVGQKAFSGIYKKAVIRVPKSKKNVYKKILKGKGQKKTVKIK